jgi:hypothetical protein
VEGMAVGLVWMLVQQCRHLHRSIYLLRPPFHGGAISLILTIFCCKIILL